MHPARISERSIQDRTGNIFSILPAMRRWNFREGRRITLNPGDIELIEDLAPTKGHRNRNLGPEDRLVLWVPIADQAVVRDSILK